MKKIFIHLWLWTFLVCTLATPASALSMEEVPQSTWGRFTRGFRRDHNFAFGAGMAIVNWNIDHFGAIDQQTYTTNGIYSNFQYTFHLQLFRGFGAMLGSSFGYLEEKSSDDDEFQPAPAYLFPGLITGLVYNITPVFRPGIYLNYYLERWSGMREQYVKDRTTRVHITVETLDLAAFVDLFYALSWGVRIEAHQRRNFYPKPRNAANFDIDATFVRTDNWYGLGAVYHLM